MQWNDSRSGAYFYDVYAILDSVAYMCGRLGITIIDL